MGTRPRDTQTWVICEDTGDQAFKGECPHHGGDACLIVVSWVGPPPETVSPDPEKLAEVRRRVDERLARLWAGDSTVTPRR